MAENLATLRSTRRQPLLGSFLCPLHSRPFLAQDSVSHWWEALTDDTRALCCISQPLSLLTAFADSDRKDFPTLHSFLFFSFSDYDSFHSASVCIPSKTLSYHILYAGAGLNSGILAIWQVQQSALFSRKRRVGFLTAHVTV